MTTVRRAFILTGAILVACSSTAAAQPDQNDPHAAQPQRPTVATHAGTVAPGWIEIEAGIESDRYHDDTRGEIAPVLAKLGIASRLQLEVQAPGVWPPDGGTGMGDLSVAVKWRFLEDAPIVANMAVLPSVKFPTGSKDNGAGTGTTDVGLLLISSHALVIPKVGSVPMDLNFGYTKRTGDGTEAPRQSLLWTASFGGRAWRPVGWVVELFGTYATSGPVGAETVVAFLTGPTVQVRSWLVLDVGVILPISGPEPKIVRGVTVDPVSGPQPRAVYAGVTYNISRVW
jgi:Putative MetA-pathway of phenol degradation